MKKIVEKNKIAFIVFSILSVALFVYIILQMDLGKAKDIVWQTDWPLVGLAVIVYGLCQLAKALRFKGLIYSAKVPTFRLMRIVVWHNLFNHLMPYKSGELTYPLLLKKEQQVSYSEGLSTLVTARIFDIMAILLLLLTALVFNLANLQIYGIKFFAVILVILLLIIFYLAVFNNNQVLNYFIRRLAVVKTGPYQLVLSKIKTLLISFQEVKKHRKTGQVFLGTLLFWLLNLLFMCLLIISLGLGSVGLYQIFLITIIVNLAMFLPISAVAEVGAVEGVYVYALLYFGQDRILAINSALVFHLLILVASLLLFVVFCGAGLFGRKSGNQDLTDVD